MATESIRLTFHPQERNHGIITGYIGFYSPVDGEYARVAVEVCDTSIVFRSIKKDGVMPDEMNDALIYEHATNLVRNYYDVVVLGLFPYMWCSVER